MGDVGYEISELETRKLNTDFQFNLSSKVSELGSLSHESWNRLGPALCKHMEPHALCYTPSTGEGGSQSRTCKSPKLYDIEKGCDV